MPLTVVHTLYEVVLTTKYLAQECINRWNYWCPIQLPTNRGSLMLATEMGAIYDDTAEAYPSPSMLSRIKDCLVTGVVFKSLNVREVYSDTDFLQVPFVHPMTGSDTEVPSPSAVALGFRSNQTRRSVGRSFKRFAGLSSPALGNGNTLPSSFVTASVQPLAEIMGVIFSGDDGGTAYEFHPCTVGKEKYEVMEGGVGTGRFAYKYYDTIEAQEDHLALDIIWEPYTGARTQRSRQEGVGQ